MNVKQHNWNSFDYQTKFHITFLDHHLHHIHFQTIKELNTWNEKIRHKVASLEAWLAWKNVCLPLRRFSKHNLCSRDYISFLSAILIKLSSSSDGSWNYLPSTKSNDWASIVQKRNIFLRFHSKEMKKCLSTQRFPLDRFSLNLQTSSSHWQIPLMVYAQNVKRILLSFCCSKILWKPFEKRHSKFIDWL